MPDKIIRNRGIEKVTAFVTHDRVEGRELLVFNHPMVGIQVPAGTVEFGESPDQAVIREVVEESGIERVKIAALLSQVLEPLPAGNGVVRRMTKVFDSPASDASSIGGYVLSRGNPVNVIGESGPFSAVVCEALDTSQDPPVSIPDVKGFLRTSNLANSVKRFFYHLVTDQTTADTWSVFVDGHEFQLFWLALSPRPRLNKYQDHWLEDHYQQLIDLSM